MFSFQSLSSRLFVVFPKKYLLQLFLYAISRSKNRDIFRPKQRIVLSPTGAIGVKCRSNLLRESHLDQRYSCTTDGLWVSEKVHGPHVSGLFHELPFTVQLTLRHLLKRFKIVDFLLVDKVFYLIVRFHKDRPE